jgi:DNA invertase Pin-like site-specific DNA recombinase
MKLINAVGYTRVSTGDQHPEIQERELAHYVKHRGWTLYKIYTDKGISGASDRRPALDALLEDCRKGKISVVCVWKFDRFARSLNQLLSALELFRALGIAFVSCTEAIDTSLPHGEMLFQIIGAIAQWERSLIAERVRAGLQHARARGKRLGRPPLRVLTPEEITRLRKERGRNSVPFRELARKYGVSVFTAHRLCGKHGQGAS